MKWAQDTNTAKQMLEDLGEEIRIDKKLPHVTELIYCLTRSWYNRICPLPPVPKETMLFVVGVGLEKVLLKPHRQHLEGECDGIYYDMDFLDYFDHAGEMKSTRISLEKFLERMPVTWERQVLSYLHTSRNVEVTLAVIHLMGSYKPPFPDFMCWHGEAAIEEIAAHWRWMLRRKEAYMASIESKEPLPPFSTNENWECGYCSYKMICDARQIAIKGGTP